MFVCVCMDLPLASTAAVDGGSSSSTPQKTFLSAVAQWRILCASLAQGEAEKKKRRHKLLKKKKEEEAISSFYTFIPFSLRLFLLPFKSLPSPLLLLATAAAAAAAAQLTGR